MKFRGIAAVTWFQKCLQARDQFPFDIFGPAFPDHKHGPAGIDEHAAVFTIASHIAAAFVAPEFGIGHWCDFSVPTAVHVPEATVNKDDLAM